MRLCVVRAKFCFTNIVQVVAGASSEKKSAPAEVRKKRKRYVCETRQIDRIEANRRKTN